MRNMRQGGHQITGLNCGFISSSALLTKVQLKVVKIQI
jgi:hypothetical protein